MSDEHVTDISESSARRWFWGILAVALAVRFPAIFYGLPFTFSEQEQRMVNIALKIGATRSVDTGMVIKGVVPWILLFWFGLYYAAGRVMGLFESTFDFAKSYFLDPSPFFVIDRLNQIAAGVLCVGLMYRLGEKLWNRRGGVWTMALAALSSCHVSLSQFANVDLFNALFATLTLLALVEFDRTSRPAHAFWAAFWCAASTATKMTGGILLLGILAVMIKRRAIGLAVAVVAVYAVSFFALSPPLWIAPVWNAKAFWADTVLRGIERPPEVGWGAVAKVLALDVFTAPGMIAAAVGLSVTYGSRALTWLGMFFPLSVLILFIRKMAPSAQYLLVVWPLLILLLTGGLLRIRNGPARTALGGLILASFLLIPWPNVESPTPGRVPSVVEQLQFIAHPHAPHEMIKWIRKNVPARSRLALMEGGGAWKGRILPMPDQVREKLRRFEHLTPTYYVMDYNMGNREMYQWLLKIMETDSSVTTFDVVNLTLDTRDELASLPRRSTMGYIEDLQPYDSWADVASIRADYFLFIDSWSETSRHAPRYVRTKEILQMSGDAPAAVFPPFILYRLSPPP